NFYASDNLPIIDALKSFIDNEEGERFIYLWGQPGVGRTHLLHACCHQMQQVHQAVMYLSLKSPELTPDVLQDMENLQLVCIDDIDTVLGNYEWEEALLHFYNRARDQRMRLLITGNDLPARLPCVLADLRSGLSWGVVFQ